LTFINPQAPQVQSQAQSAKISTNQNVTLSMPEKICWQLTNLRNQN